MEETLTLPKGVQKTTLYLPRVVHRKLRSDAALNGQTLTEVLLAAVYKQYPELQESKQSHHSTEDRTTSVAQPE